MTYNKNIFLVAFRYKPFKGVGVLRISYWFEMLKKEGMPVTLITAEPGESEEGVVRIPQNFKNDLLSKIIRDKSFFWKNDLTNLLITNKLLSDNDVILFTGGPFLYFMGLWKIRKHFPEVKIILDYRDPFAVNPRFDNFLLKRKIKEFFEKRFNAASDTVIAVNDYCEKLLIAPPESIVIENGYDEREFVDVDMSAKDEKAFIYAGTFYHDGSPELFLDEIVRHPGLPEFHYCGNAELLVSDNRIIHHGFQTYRQTVALLKKSSVGVIITGGKEFESTTKIFDYFAAKLKILIITKGEIMTGNLQQIVQDNPNVVWATNDKEGIRAALDTLFQNKYREWNFDRFSRRTGYEKLRFVINK